MKSYNHAHGFLFNLGTYPLSFCLIGTRRELHLDNFISRITPPGESATSRPLVNTKGNSMNFTKKIAAGLSLVAASITSASAAVPADVTAALAAGLTDATTVAGAALIIVVGVTVFKYMRRAL